MLLNKDYELIKIVDSSKETATGCLVDFGDMFREILKSKADGIIICQNNIGKKLTPTSEDDTFTEYIKFICILLGINFLDHIILNSGGYYSYLHHGE